MLKRTSVPLSSKGNSITCPNIQEPGQLAQKSRQLAKKPRHNQLKNCCFSNFFLSSKFNRDIMEVNVKKKSICIIFKIIFGGKLDFIKISFL